MNKALEILLFWMKYFLGVILILMLISQFGIIGAGIAVAIILLMIGFHKKKK